MGPFEQIIGKLTQTGATMRNPEKAINIFSLRDNILNNPNFEVFTETELAEKFKISKSEASKLIAATKKAFPNLGPILGTEKYPNVDRKLFKNIRMVSNTISNYLQQNKINPKEARALLLSENMAELFPGREVAKDKVALKFYKWGPNSPERKVVFDSVKKQTGIDLTNEMYNNIVEETKKVRSESGQDARIFAKQKNINRDLVRLNKDVVLKNLLKQPFTGETRKAILKRATQILKQEDVATVSRRLFMLGEALQGKTRNVQGIDFEPELGDKIIDTQQQFRNRYAFSNLVYDHYAKTVDNVFGNQTGRKFIPYYQKQIKNILDKGDSPDEIFSLRASARRGLTPYAIFTQALKEDLNEKVKGARIDSALGRTHKNIQNVLKGRNYATISNQDKAAIKKILNTYDDQVKNTLKEFPELKKYKIITSANFDFKNPPEKSIANFDKRFKNNPEIKKAFQDSYKKVGYSMKVPKEFLTQKEYLKKFSGQKGFSTAPVLLATLGGTLLTGAALAGVPKTPDVSPPKEVSPTPQTTGPGVETAVGAGAAGAAFVPKARESVGKFVQKIPKPIRTVGGFLGKRVLPPVFLGMSAYDLGEKGRYETPGEYAYTVAQQPLDFLGLGFLAEQAKENLRRRRYASPEELKELDQGPGIYDYGEIPSSQTDRDTLKRMLDERAKRMEFGQAGVFDPYAIDAYQDTGDEPVYRIPEATLRSLEREEQQEQGLGSLMDMYGP